MRVLWAIPWSRVINNIYQQQIAFVSVRRRRPSAQEATPSDGNSLNPATLPIDVQFCVRTPYIAASTSKGYIQKLQERLDWAYKTAHEVSKKESKCSKRRYDQIVKCTKLEPVDLVLVRQKAFKGKQKISDRRKNTHYCVIQHIGGHLPVYKVQLVDDTTKFRIIHRNLLFPLPMRNKSDEKQKVMEINKPKLAGSNEEKILLLNS